ncbi:class I SAM-dependent methyltransferase [Salinibaculum rarum]|uniref:class I SAM-dependent methyltransferase n=1 Tax=Salinibaculum rarum TaxID=3058903 RepID=UPI00265EC472|nr:class I SAM-dependent methyltransferase [Salinibaculum sp. KK48]
MTGQNFGPNLAEVILSISGSKSVEKFIETGTLYGVTARWASQNFEEVVTIEIDRGLLNEAQENTDADNIEFRHGDSAEILSQILPTLNSPATFYLDAHCGYGVEKAKDNFEVSDDIEDINPLLAELEQLSKHSSGEHIIIIDDVIHFLQPPPRPFPPDEFPTIQDIIHAIEDISDSYHVVVFEGHIIAVPQSEKQILIQEIRNIHNPENRSQIQQWVLALWQNIVFPAGRRIYRKLG